MQSILFFSLCLALSATAGSVPGAQAPEDSSPREAQATRPLPARDALRVSHATHVLGGVPTGFGHRYKARFEPGRLAFLPALGKGAERDFPLCFTLEGVWRGETLAHTADTSVVARADGDLLRYARGPLEERYEVTPEGVHQSFVFHEPLAGTGDLIVRGALSTDLVGEPADDGSLLFRRDGIPSVRWGAVTGIDADGRAAAGSLRMHGTTIELVLPAAFVDAAAFPLVLDPLIGTEITVNDSASSDSSPEVASINSRHLVVWERSFSLTHNEVYGQRLDLDGSLAGGLIPISTGAAVIARQPTTGYVSATDSFLVAWSYAPSFLSTPQIRCARIDSFSGALSPSVAVSASANVQSTPDVGGDLTGTDDEAFVVWRESGLGVRGRTVSVPNGLNPVPLGLAFTVDGVTASIDPIHPRISKAVRNGVLFLVVWQRSISGGARSFAHGRVYDRDGVAQGPAFTLYDNAFLRHERPDCDGDGKAFLVAWQRSESPTAPDVFDIVCRALFWNGAAMEKNALVRVVENDVNDNETLPSVAMTTHSAAVAYLDENGASVDVYLKNVDPFTGIAVGEVGLTVFVGASATGVSLTRTLNDDVLLSWDDDGDVFAQRYDTLGEFFDEHGGCGSGGKAVIPNALTGNADFRIHLRGATPGVLAACVTALSEFPIACGTCTLVPDLEAVYYDTSDANGNASVNIPLVGAYGGVTFYSQWVTFVPIGACPLAPIDFADALRTTIDSNP